MFSSAMLVLTISAVLAEISGAVPIQKVPVATGSSTLRIGTVGASLSLDLVILNLTALED